MTVIVSPALSRACSVAQIDVATLRKWSGHRTRDGENDPEVRARWKAWFWLVIVEGKSLPIAGRMVHRHHTSVLYGVRKHAQRVYGLPMDATIAEIISAHTRASESILGRAA